MEIIRADGKYAAAAAEAEAACLGTAWSEKQIREAAERDDTLYLAALEDGVLCGTASCVFSLFEGMIENIAVLPGYRRRGIATALLAEIEREAKDRGLCTLSLEAASKNKAAVLLYEKVGFKSVGVRKGFYRRENDDALIMVKEIHP